jgi:hypothetical protein
MTQDIIVTLIAFAIVVGFAVRWWRRRGRQESTCASCDSSGTKSAVRVPKAPTPIDPSRPEIKPVAFFGGSGKRRIH